MSRLGTSYGRGGATTNQMDVRFADLVLIMGSNMVECHPVGFRFVMEAKQRGAQVIHADPRFTCTSAMADLYAPLRAGTDIVFLGGLIRYILEEEYKGISKGDVVNDLSALVGDPNVTIHEAKLFVCRVERSPGRG